MPIPYVTPLAIPGQIADFPGAPFPTAVVTAAGDRIRREAGWHIAPAITETLVLDTEAGEIIRLPSLRVTSVGSITTAGGLPLTGWTLSANGNLYLAQGWPGGFGAVTVAFTHGYSTVPGDLLPVLAEYCQRSMVNAALTHRSETAGVWSESETYNTRRRGESNNPDRSAVDYYQLPQRF